MATAVLTLRTVVLLRAAPSTLSRKHRRSLRVSAENREGSSSSVAVDRSAPSPPPGFKPPEPKRFSVRPDKFLDVLGASLALPFRLGTGAFVLGYSASFVSENDIPPNQYSTKIAGLTLKETSKLGPRPEKPIEIYDFERFITPFAFVCSSLVFPTTAFWLEPLVYQLLFVAFVSQILAIANSSRRK